jgi:hypothetical protein
MIVYRDRRKFDKVWVRLWSSPALLGLAILLRDYDLIPSIVEWTLLGFTGVLFWISFYAMFFRKKGITS